MGKNRKKTGTFIIKTASRRYNSIFMGIYCGRCANNLRHIYIARRTNSMREWETNATFYCSYTRLNENVFALPFHIRTKPNMVRWPFCFCGLSVFFSHVSYGHKMPSGTFSHLVCVHFAIALFMFETHILHLTDSESVPFRLPFHHSNRAIYRLVKEWHCYRTSGAIKRCVVATKIEKRKVFRCFWITFSTSGSIFSSTFCFIACTTSWHNV